MWFIVVDNLLMLSHSVYRYNVDWSHFQFFTRYFGVYHDLIIYSFPLIKYFNSSTIMELSETKKKYNSHLKNAYWRARLDPKFINLHHHHKKYQICNDTSDCLPLSLLIKKVNDIQIWYWSAKPMENNSKEKEKKRKENTLRATHSSLQIFIHP